MFEIKKPTELENKISIDTILSILCENMMARIEKVNKEGNRRTTFYAAGFYGNLKTGDISRQPTRETIRDPDYVYFRFEDYEDLIAPHFKAAGYRILPTGRVGGVMQLSKDIMW